jgi:hypothetical protein
VNTVDPPARLVDAVALARAAAVEDAATDLGADLAATAVGEHLEAVEEDPGAVTHYFAATQGGYRGWRWSVTLGGGHGDAPVTVSEVVLLPGSDALVAPAWVPWEERIRPGDLGVGDLLPPQEGDQRLVPAYVESDDPAVEEVATEIGLGRATVLSRVGREEAAQRWHDGPHGPGADMARAAPGHCGTCGFFLSLAGSLRGAFGVCGNEYAPADGSVVEVGFGCGAHSDVHVDTTSPVTVAELVYDDGVDIEHHEPPAPVVTDAAPTEAEATAPAEVADTEVADTEVADTEVADTEAPAPEGPDAEPVAAAAVVDEPAPAEAAPTEQPSEGPQGSADQEPVENG